MVSPGDEAEAIRGADDSAAAGLDHASMDKTQQNLHPTGRRRLGTAAWCLPLAVALTTSLGAAGAARPAPAAAAALATAKAPTAKAPVFRHGYISISGGVKLAYDLTRPAAAGRFPVALEYNDYTAGTDNSAEDQGSDAGRLLAAGFAVLGVNQPGSGCSGGVNNIGDVNEWGSAGAQVVEWAGAQPWSTGHVGMFGSSWTGISQLGIASFRPRGLDAITPYHVTADFYRDAAYLGGVYNATWMNAYAAGLIAIDRQAAEPGIKRGDQQCIKDFDAHVIANRPYSIAANALASPFDEDSYWQAAPVSRLSRIDIPVLGCQSWQDGEVSSRATELYSDTFNRKASWFIGMNGPHDICESGQPLTMMVNFLRHYVAGADNGWPKTPHITILHEATNAATPAWVSTYDNWSTVVKPVALDFQAGGSLGTGTGAGGTSSFSGPDPSQSGNWTARPARGSSVSYTTPPLTRDADFFGPGSVNLWLSSTAPDTDIEVILSEVRPDGQEQYIQAGWLDVAQRQLAPAGNGPQQSTALRPYQTHTMAGYQPLTPGTPVYARVELFPFEHVFRAGSSLRLTIDSAMGTVQSTGMWGLTGLPAPFTDTVYATAARPSQVVLGLIPGATAKAPMPACNTIAGEPCRPNPAPVPSGRLTIP